MFKDDIQVGNVGILLCPQCVVLVFELVILEGNVFIHGVVGDWRHVIVLCHHVNAATSEQVVVVLIQADVATCQCRQIAIIIGKESIFHDSVLHFYVKPVVAGCGTESEDGRSECYFYVVFDIHNCLCIK